MIEIGHSPAENLVTIRASGKLTKQDYDQALPELEQAIRASGGALNAVIVVDRLKGWELEALWKDLQFDMRHYGDFERIAVVGNLPLQDWSAAAASAVTNAEVETFTVDQLDRAREWAIAA